MLFLPVHNYSVVLKSDIFAPAKTAKIITAAPGICDAISDEITSTVFNGAFYSSRRFCAAKVFNGQRYR